MVSADSHRRHLCPTSKTTRCSSNSRSAALVSRAGSIDWLCFPRFDSAACFAGLLGGPENGHWTITATDVMRTERKYRDRSLVLETIHHTATGSVAVIDAMVPTGAGHHLVRLVEGRSGTVSMRTELRIRFDYGSVIPWVRSRRRVTARGWWA